MTNFVKLAEHKNPPQIYARAKELRQESTLSEQILWEALRKQRKQGGAKFRRQHPIAPYFVDFACLKARLVIEIDGDSHDIRVEEDKRRDEYLKEQGFTVMRFSNQDVRTNCDGVLETIMLRIADIMKDFDAPHP